MLGAKDGLESIIIKAMPEFRDWYIKFYEEYPSHYDVEVINLADRIVSEGSSVFNVDSVECATKIDKLIDAFVGAYCDHGDGRKLLRNTHQPVMKVSHYHDVFDCFQGKSTARSFWNFILKGRPLRRNAEAYPYLPADGVFRVSFASFDEVREIKREFENMNFFGDRDSIAFLSAKGAINEAYEADTGLVVTVA